MTAEKGIKAFFLENSINYSLHNSVLFPTYVVGSSFSQLLPVKLYEGEQVLQWEYFVFVFVYFLIVTIIYCNIDTTAI